MACVCSVQILMIWTVGSAAKQKSARDLKLFAFFLKLALTAEAVPAVEAQKASELAEKAIERIVDKSMPAEEQERRKRALIGPRELRDVREDLPKPKKI